MIIPRRTDDRWSGRRARLVAGVLGLLFAVIVGRSAQIAFAGPDAETLAAGPSEVARRADIVDRNGELLATSLAAWSLAADPNAIWDAKEVAAGVASVLPGINAKELTTRLSDKSRRFVWIQRGLSPRQRQQVFELGLEGLRFEEEMRRVYPGGRLAGHFLGFTNIDGKGVEGVERLFEERLAKGGEPLQLTLDAGVQFALEAELEAATKDFDMIGAAAVVVEAKTGAVRAIASWPAIDPNLPGSRAENAKLDRSLNAVYELGSVYKPLTVAAALEAGVLTTADTFDVSQPIRVGPATIRDIHEMPHPQVMTAADILAYSSNIGTVGIAQRLGAEREKAFLGSVGLLSRTTAAGAAPAAPLLPTVWDALTTATVAYGHGIAVTPLTFAMTYAPFANGGEYMPPLFLEPADPGGIEKTRVMSETTAKSVLDMLRRTVVAGTGRLGDAPGFQVAGKTGTAEKPGPSGYDPDRNVTSFAAVFPASRPQFVVLVLLDEAKPKVGEARTAAYTSAAVAGRFIARAAPLLGVAPVLEQQPAATTLREPARPELRTMTDDSRAAL